MVFSSRQKWSRHWISRITSKKCHKNWVTIIDIRVSSSQPTKYIEHQTTIIQIQKGTGMSSRSRWISRRIRCLIFRNSIWATAHGPPTLTRSHHCLPSTTSVPLSTWGNQTITTLTRPGRRSFRRVCLKIRMKATSSDQIINNLAIFAITTSRIRVTTMSRTQQYRHCRVNEDTSTQLMGKETTAWPTSKDKATNLSLNSHSFMPNITVKMIQNRTLIFNILIVIDCLRIFTIVT